MKANGSYSALVSRIYFVYRESFCLPWLYENHANVLLTNENKLTEKIQKPILGKKAKVEQLDRIASKFNLFKTGNRVGDGANDLDMLSKAGTGVALHAKPSVAEQCDIRINFGDLTALLFIQGYSKRILYFNLPLARSFSPTAYSTKVNDIFKTHIFHCFSGKSGLASDGTNNSNFGIFFSALLCIDGYHLRRTLLDPEEFLERLVQYLFLELEESLRLQLLNYLSCVVRSFSW